MIRLPLSRASPLVYRNLRMRIWGGGSDPTPLLRNLWLYGNCVLSSHRKQRSDPCAALPMPLGYPGGSVRQTSAALGAAAGQHLAAVLGGHTLAEAVLLGTLALLGLIGTKHGGHLLIQFQAGLPGPTTALVQAVVCILLPVLFSERFWKNAHKNTLFKKALSIIDDSLWVCQPYFLILSPAFFPFFPQSQHLVVHFSFAYQLCYTFK